MAVNLEKLNKLMSFFLRNYDHRLEGYQQNPPNKQVIISVNKAERKILPKVESNLISFERELIAGNEKLKGPMSKVTPKIMEIIMSFHTFLDREKDYFDGKITLEQFESYLASYTNFKNKVPLDGLTRLMNSTTTSGNIKRKLFEEFSHIGDFRNVWLFSAVFVEWFTVILSGYASVQNGTDFQHVSIQDWSLYYIVCMFLVILRIPDRTLIVLDSLKKTL
jgi:hypothetical protein